MTQTAVDLLNNKDWLEKRIKEQNLYIVKQICKHDLGKISDERCRLLVDSAVAIKEGLKLRVFKLDWIEKVSPYISRPIQMTEAEYRELFFYE